MEFDWETARADSIGQRIRRSREAKGLTQEQLAEQIDVPQPRISEWERDVYPGGPGWSAIARIAHVLGVSMDYLYKGH